MTQLQAEDQKPTQPGDPELRIIRWIFAAIALLVAISLVVYWVLGFLALLGHDLFKGVDIAANISGNIGVPGAALAAFLIVYIYWIRFPPSKSQGSVQITIAGSTFSGPAGPVTLWVMCFLAFTLAIWLFRLSK